MDLGLEGKRVLVTGSTGGLGSEMARRFASEGASVVVHGRDADRAEAIRAEIASTCDGVAVVLADLSTDEGAARVAEGALSAFGGIDVLVNNAGGQGALTKFWLDVEPHEWLDMYSSDVVSAVRLVRSLVPGMMERGWGRIIQISTGTAVKPFPIGPQYHAAKAALGNSTASLAAALGSYGITVNTVLPGPIHTAGIEAYWRQMAPAFGWGDTWSEIEANGVRQFTPNPIGRLGKPAEVAAAVLFLASEAASYVTGAAIRVDGGAVGTV